MSRKYEGIFETNSSTKTTGLAAWFSKVFASFFSLFKKKKANHAQEEQGIELQNLTETELKSDPQTPSEEPKPSKIRAFFSSIAKFFSGLFSKKAKQDSSKLQPTIVFNNPLFDPNAADTQPRFTPAYNGLGESEQKKYETGMKATPRDTPCPAPRFE